MKIKTSILSALLGAFLFGCGTEPPVQGQKSSSAEIVTGWDEYGLNGKVKSLTITQSSAVETSSGWEKAQNGVPTVIEVTFDTIGKTQEQITRVKVDSENRVFKSSFSYRDDTLYEIYGIYDQDRSVNIVTQCAPFVKRERVFLLSDSGDTISETSIKWSGKRIVFFTNKDDNYSMTDEFEYQNGRETICRRQEKSNDSDPFTTVINYTYLDEDELGNWTERLNTIERKSPYPSTIYKLEERIIEYY